jgi:hypothetical protein
MAMLLYGHSDRHDSMSGLFKRGHQIAFDEGYFCF